MVVVVVVAVVVVVVVVVVAVECMPDPAADVGSCCESDGENFFTEENVDRTWSEAAQVVETPTVELDEDHFTSSSSDSDAESVVLEAPVNFFVSSVVADIALRLGPDIGISRQTN